MRVLIVEDDRTIAANIYDFLSARGHAVDAAGDGVTALHLAVRESFDVIVLDIGLPGLDGIRVCQKLRGDALLETPILMLTARDTLEDKLKGFGCGADDYLIKPFSLKELEARLLALHKRHRGRVTAKTLNVGELSLDPRTLQVKFREKQLKLTPKCIRLLETLMSDPGRVFTRADLEAAVWGDTQETSDTLRSHMHVLRRTLLETGGYDPVLTVHGIGYRIAQSETS